MNQQSIERLYQLLPAIYRQRDAAEGEPLRALLAVMETELQAIEADIAGLYENWFIETCEEWVVPYIADLLGISSLSDQESTRLSHRSYVANTIAYRRRKGVSAILESITLDVTGWRSKVVEGFDRLNVTQQVNHVRPGKGSTFDIRSKTVLDPLNLPFDTASRTVDVRRITSQYSIRGQSNSLNLGLFVWRLQSYLIQNSPAAEVTPGCYTVHPLGRDIPLFNRPQTKAEVAQRTEAIHLPCPISVEAFTADLQEYKTKYWENPEQRPPNTQFYGLDRSFHLVKDGVSVSPMQLISLRLENWQAPQLNVDEVAIDVERGRIRVPLPTDGKNPPRLNVSYCYGFSGDIGGGSYDRHQTLADLSNQPTWTSTVGRNETLQTLQEALTAWQTSTLAKGMIRLTDNGIYGCSNSDVSSLRLTLPSSGQLILEAADGVRPTIQTPDVRIEAGTGASLTLNGLLLNGKLTIRGKLKLTLIHCTVLGGIAASQSTDLDQSTDLQVSISSSIVGPLRLPDQQASLTIQDSIVDSRPDATTIAEKAEDFAITGCAMPGPVTTLERTTVFGRVNLGELAIASNVIFTAPITVERQHSGSIRFSYVPPDSITPPRYRCPLDLGSTQEITPRFTSVTYREPSYAQLSQQCTQEVSAGADDGSEMGAFHLLHQPQRSAYLHLNLDEYVPSGLDIGIFYIT